MDSRYLQDPKRKYVLSQAPAKAALSPECPTSTFRTFSTFSRAITSLILSESAFGPRNLFCAAGGGRAGLWRQDQGLTVVAGANAVDPGIIAAGQTAGAGVTGAAGTAATNSLATAQQGGANVSAL